MCALALRRMYDENGIERLNVKGILLQYRPVAARVDHCCPKVERSRESGLGRETEGGKVFDFLAVVLHRGSSGRMMIVKR
jgi:hypothetical protein